MNMKLFSVILTAILLFGIFIDVVDPVYGFMGRVPTSHVGIVTTFGKMSDETLEPGFHVKGFFEVLNPMSVQTQSMQVSLAAFSSDIQQVNALVTLNYNVDKTNAVTLFRDVGKNYVTSLMNPRVQENTKIVFSHYTAENLVQKRDTLSAEILTLMQEDLAPYGINVSAVAIEDIDFTDAFTNAVEAKQVATQEKLTAQTQQERLTMEATAEAGRAKIEAEAAAERQKIAAEAEAYSVTVRAEAEAEANAKVAASLTQELIDYTKAQLWNGEMPTVMSDATPILDMTDFAFEE